MSTILDLIVPINDTLNDNNIINDKIINNFNKIINKLLADQSINLLQYSYLNSFSHNNEQNIINIKWFIEIINDICDYKQSKKIKKIFKKYFTLKNKKLHISNKIKSGILKLDTIQLTEEQQTASKKLITFLMDKNMKTFGLYGYAGTGKTTSIVEIMNYLLKNKYINSVVLTAPTNKAVNVIKTKFKPYIDSLYQEITGNVVKPTQNLEELLDVLYSNEIKIDFITIHKLLKFKTEYGAEGELIFTRSEKKIINMIHLYLIMK